MVPGRKFCTSTSERVISLRMIFAASGRFRSSDSDRLPRFVETNRAENSPEVLIDCRLRRVISPPSGSILITSAPWSARNAVANGPETTLVKSSTLTPVSGPDISYLAFIYKTYIVQWRCESKVLRPMPFQYDVYTREKKSFCSCRQRTIISSVYK